MAYDLARQGQSVEREPRPVQITAIRILRTTARGILLEVDCGRGTYIRTLCHDLARACRSAGHMGTLIRTRSGAFTLETACTLEEIRERDPAALLLPCDFPIQHLPAVHVRMTAARFVYTGNPLEEREVDSWPEPGQKVRIYLGDRFAGLGERTGALLRFDFMILEREECSI